jgi:hypothetical protein
LSPIQASSRESVHDQLVRIHARATHRVVERGTDVIPHDGVEDLFVATLVEVPRAVAELLVHRIDGSQQPGLDPRPDGGDEPRDLVVARVAVRAVDPMLRLAAECAPEIIRAQTSPSAAI